MKYLVRRIAYAYVEVWQIGFYNIPQHDFQPLFLGFALHSFRDFGCHARIQLYRYYSFRFFKDLHCEISSAGADLKNNLDVR